MSDILSYFLNLFLNTSASILHFFNLHIVCPITILFLEWLLLYSFSSEDSSQFLFLSRIIFLLSLFIYGPWNMLFCRINKRQKAWKVFLYFLWCFQSFGYVVYLLWNR